MKLSYNDFLSFKNEFLRDPDPVLSFGASFCAKFEVTDETMREALCVSFPRTVAQTRVVIDCFVEWEP